MLVSGNAVVVSLFAGCDGTTPCEVTVLAPARDVDGSTGVGFSTLQIGHLLNRLVSDLDDRLRWRLDEPTGEQVSAPLAEPDRWRETLDVSGRRWVLEVYTEEPYEPLSSTGLRLLVLLGAGGSLIGAVSAYAIADDIEARERIERLEHLHEERDRFQAALSHELRTPLTAVVGVLRILAATWEDSLREIAARSSPGPRDSRALATIGPSPGGSSGARVNRARRAGGEPARRSCHSWPSSSIFTSHALGGRDGGLTEPLHPAWTSPRNIWPIGAAGGPAAGDSGLTRTRGRVTGARRGSSGRR